MFWNAVIIAIVFSVRMLCYTKERKGGGVKLIRTIVILSKRNV